MKDKRTKDEVKRCRIVRGGCEARMVIKFDRERALWAVTIFDHKHNHPLIKMPTKVGTLRSHKMIDTLCNCGVGASKISQVINAANDGTKEVEKVTPREISNYLRKYRKNNVSRKCINVTRYFQQKRAQDDNFFFVIETDEDNQARSVLWADEKI